MSTRSLGSTRRYCLVSVAGETTRRQALSPGRNVLGSDTACDVRLAERGVSRRHAVVTVESRGLRLDDLDSKNGTFINNARVRSSRLEPGDEIGVGPVALRLEAIESDDVELALHLDSEASPRLTESSVALLRETTELLPRTVDRWLRAIDAVAEGLLAPPPVDLTAALGRLRETLDVAGVALLEAGEESTSVILASSGRLGALSWIEAPGPQPEFHTGFTAEGTPLTAYRGQGEDGSEVRLMLWGEFSDRSTCELALRILTRLLDRQRPRPTAPPRRDQDAELRFPAGFVRCASPAMNSIYRQLARLARGDLPILLVGETGAGKEHLVRLLHETSSRRGPLVSINCAAIPRELLEAELFGIGKNVATGVAPRHGKFRLADGGTVFLDEISEMPSELQAKLLRVLQDQEIHPLGLPPESVDVRVVAATNADVELEKDEGRLRRDLYFRLAGFLLRVPPLRERREDIPLLAQHFLRRFMAEAAREIPGVTVKATRVLMEYPWPGNVRELEHEMRRLAYVCPSGQPIDSSLLSETLIRRRPAAPRPEGEGDAGTSAPARSELAPSSPRPWVEDLEDLSLEDIERQVVDEALRRTGGNKARAARLLGVSRPALGRKVDRFHRRR